MGTHNVFMENIDPVEANFFSTKKDLYLFLFLHKMSTHNIDFCGEIRKIFTWYSFLSVAMTTKKNAYHDTPLI